MTDGINRENLQTLATYLAYGNGASAGVEFDMSLFTQGSSTAHTCKTAGCAVGFAPFAGIKKRNTEDFLEYSERTLIADGDGEEWGWCFSSFWAVTDNSRLGAAKRIQYLLDKGLPRDGFEYDASGVEIYAATEVKK